VAGAILHVHYRTQWREFPLPHISLALPLAQDLPVVDSILKVNVPKGTPFHFAFENLSAPDPTVQQTSYSTSYSWHFQNSLPSPHEALAPPHLEPRVLFSTFPDWKAFAEWYGRITRLTAEPTPEIAAKAKEVTQRAATPKDKVLALYNYVTTLRYVAVPLGVNSLRPHAASNVLRNQFGDCKDKANLFNALLHAVDLDAHLVLVPRFNQAHDAVPGFAFNHAISRVRCGSDTFWADTTDDICRFGLLPPGDPGRNVLVVDGETDQLAALPAGGPEQNQLQLSAEVDASGTTQFWPVRLQATARGFSDYQLREAARQVKDDLGTLPLLSVRWRPAGGSFSLVHQRMTLVFELDQEFSWEAEGTLIGLSSGSEPWSTRAPFWLPKEWDLALHRRRSPLYLNQGYALTLDENVTFQLPPRLSKEVLPSACENVKPPLRWRIAWTRVANDKLQAHFQAELSHGDLSLAETAACQEQLRALLAAFAVEARFTGTP
jgi:hypothetical protein